MVGGLGGGLVFELSCERGEYKATEGAVTLGARVR